MTKNLILVYGYLCKTQANQSKSQIALSFRLLKTVFMEVIIWEAFSEVHFGSVRNLGRLEHNCFLGDLSFASDFNGDLASYFFIRLSRSYVHPRVLIYLINSGSFIGIVSEHSLNEVFEFGAQVSSIHFLPVTISLTRHKHIVEVVRAARFHEREDASN